MVGVHAASFMEMRLSLGNTVPEEKQVDSRKISLVTSIGKESRD